MVKKLIVTLLFLINFSVVFAQQTYTISGIVKDKVGILPGAGVYISGYKIATVTNEQGKFILPNLAPGNYDILVQMMGYTPFSKNIIISKKSEILNITLNENATLLKEVIIKPDPNRPYYIALFKDFFIGKTPNSMQCKILNTEILSFDDDKKNGMLTVTASDFLIIENLALGYRIKYLLEDFEYNYKKLKNKIYYKYHHK